MEIYPRGSGTGPAYLVTAWPMFVCCKIPEKAGWCNLRSLNFRTISCFTASK